MEGGRYLSRLEPRTSSLTMIPPRPSVLREGLAHHCRSINCTRPDCRVGSDGREDRHGRGGDGGNVCRRMDAATPLDDESEGRQCFAVGGEAGCNDGGSGDEGRRPIEGDGTGHHRHSRGKSDCGGCSGRAAATSVRVVSARGRAHTQLTSLNHGIGAQLG